jgi:hypothetical protein
MLKELFLICVFFTCFNSINCAFREFQRFHRFEKDQSTKTNEAFFIGDENFAKLEDQSLIKKYCQGKDNKHCNKLRSFLACASKKPSFVRLEAAKKALNSNTATDEDFNIIASYEHCQSNDWKDYNYFQLFFHIREILDHNSTRPEESIGEQAYILKHMFTLQKECHARETTNSFHSDAQYDERYQE